MPPNWLRPGTKCSSPPSPISRTPQRETTPGGKRGLLHSEIHPSFFTALGIPVPTNKEPFKTRIWPVLTREKNAQKETLVLSKNQAPPSLPLSLRFSGPMGTEDLEWDPSSAWAELTQRIELELEEKILRFKFSIGVRPQLEWTWHEELSRGGMECTILVHIDTSASVLSVQNRKHFHWKNLDLIPNMNNEVEFSISAHNLLKKVDAGDMTRQAHNNRAASILASPQAAMKKRFTKLDLARMLSPQVVNLGLSQAAKEGAGGDQKPLPREVNSHPGSINQPAARNRLTYD